jgi:hypothetical protein
MEQRSYPRFEVSAVCHLCGLGCDSSQGVTENLSRGGLLLRLESRHMPIALPRIGDVVTVDVELPTNRHFGQKYLRCRGTVVRVASARRSPARIALSVSQMEFSNSLRKAAGKAAGAGAAERIFMEQ